MILHLHAAREASLVTLVCPHCRHLQQRVRKPAPARYRCTACHRLFTRAQASATR